MTNMTIEIKAPDLVDALRALADAIAGKQQAAPQQETAAAPQQETAAAQQQETAAAPQHKAPAVPVVPVAAPAAYTHAQVGRAGAELVAADPAKMPALLSMLQRYGVEAITQLDPASLSAVAAEMREMGAQL